MQVGDLPEKKIPVHVSVIGTPLIMQLSKVLLPGFPRNPPAAEPLARLQSRSQTALGISPGVLQDPYEGLLAGMALPFGQLLADTAAERCFYVFNTASMPVQLKWTFYRSDSTELLLCSFCQCSFACQQNFYPKPYSCCSWIARWLCIVISVDCLDRFGHCTSRNQSSAELA